MRPLFPRFVTPSATLLAGFLVAVLAGLGMAGAAVAADDQARIAHVERTDSGFSILVDVPAGDDVDTSAVTATVNGDSYDATAQSAGTDTSVKRVTVLAIDTSDSMGARGKFTAAKQAATLFVRNAPANVAIGIVTFDATVSDALAPTTDRSSALSTISSLQLSRGTKLYDGVREAVGLTGDSGQRTVIVLSDGADTGSTTSLSQLTTLLSGTGSAAGDDGPVVDVVALDQGGSAVASLRKLAIRGQVIPADDGALVKAFADEAAALNRQVAVSVDVPSSVSADQSTLAIQLPTSTGSLSVEATVPGATTTPSAPSIPVAASNDSTSGFQVPHWALYAGVIVFGVGLLLALLMLVPARPVPLSAEERVASYASAAGSAGGVAAPPVKTPEPALAQATQAVSEVLQRNRGLEQRIALRLDGAGSELKPAEWLLVQVGVFLLVSIVGLLLGGGNLLVGFLFMVVGAVGPWIYLGLRRSRRRKAFNAALPDTLQLMSGSLSAGLSLAQSVDTIVREGADPVAGEFRRVLVETRLGVPLEDAFDGVAERFESEDFRWVVMAIRIQRQVGGNLAELLDTVAGTMREREYMRRQVAALAAEGKLSAYVLAGLPPLFLVYLVLTNRSYVSILFTDPRGWVMLASAALLLGLGAFWMSRLVKVEV